MRTTVTADSNSVKFFSRPHCAKRRKSTGAQKPEKAKEEAEEEEERTEEEERARRRKKNQRKNQRQNTEEKSSRGAAQKAKPGTTLVNPARDQKAFFWTCNPNPKIKIRLWKRRMQPEVHTFTAGMEPERGKGKATARSKP
jgi:hypothetical protein